MRWLSGLAAVGLLALVVVAVLRAADDPVQPTPQSPAAGLTAESPDLGDGQPVAEVGGGDAASESGASTAGIGNLVASLTVFVLAIFVGFEIITKVPPTLHTPLMSGSNAISGITIVGALLVAGGGADVAGATVPAGTKLLAACLGTAAVVLATLNVVGGFLVTHRMLSMFRQKK